MNGRKLTAMLLAALLTVCLFAGCAASASIDADKLYNAPEEFAPESIGNFTGAAGDLSQKTEQAPLPTDRKLIKTVDIDAETEDLDALVRQLNEEIARQGGYVESQQLYNGNSSTRNRRLQMVIRVPAEHLDALVNQFSDSANIISREEAVEDVTLQYVSTETRIAALETEIERLLALMEQAENMSDLLEIEERLTNVRYELEHFTAQLKVMESQISYSTVRLYVSEVRQYTPVEEKEGFWQRVGNSNLRGLENIWYGITEFGAFLLGNLPYLVILAILAVGGTLFGKYLYRRTKSKEPEKK